MTFAAMPASAQSDPPPDCRFICELEWKAEPTFTTENLARAPRVASTDGTIARVGREQIFELVLALDLKTRLRRLGFTAEASAAPFHDDNEVELEFETNFYWLTTSMSRGWVTSHFDVVDQFSPAARPDSRRAYTHKLDFELDTAVHVFKWLPERWWLRGFEVETSLDYMATGIPKRGDTIEGSTWLDDASHWSLSLVLVIPVGPF